MPRYEMNRLRLMLHSWDWINNQDQIYTIEYDPSLSTCTGRDNNNFPFEVDEDFPLVNLQFGYCNGLVCISSYDKDILCLWNPSSNEYKHLPKIPLPDAPAATPDVQDYYICVYQYGFGYDYEIGEFKVVCLAQYVNDFGSEVQASDVYLYTSGSNTWITLDSICYTVYGKATAAHVHGVIYWKAHRDIEGSGYRSRVILSFNFEKEIFQEMPWPDLSREMVSTDLCVLGGSLCVWAFNPDIGAEVWEFIECKLRKSWNKLFAMDVKKHLGLVRDFLPLQPLNNGEFLLGFDTDVGFHVHQYDTKHETTRLLFAYEDTEYYSSITTVYVESLVSPSLGRYVDDNHSGQ